MNGERYNGYRQPGVIMCDIVLHHSLPFLPHSNSERGTGRGGMRVEIPRDRRTMSNNVPLDRATFSRLH